MSDPIDHQTNFMFWDLLGGALQIGFVLFMVFCLMVLLCSLLLAWSWAQFWSEQGTDYTLTDILAIAGVEWGALMTLSFAQIRKLQPVFEAPRFDSEADTTRAPPSQIPICLVPSLHWSSRIFRFLVWRLRAHHFKSLWPLNWKSFLNDPVFLEEQLARHLKTVTEATGSSRLHLISFGSSRPIIERTLTRSDVKGLMIRWIAVSAPSQKGAALRFLKTPRLQAAFAPTARQSVKPDLLIVGAKDTLCYPTDIFGQEPNLLIADVGHYGALLHSKTIDAILSDLDSDRMKERHQRLASHRTV